MLWLGGGGFDDLGVDVAPVCSLPASFWPVRKSRYARFHETLRPNVSVGVVNADPFAGFGQGRATSQKPNQLTTLTEAGRSGLRSQKLLQFASCATFRLGKARLRGMPKAGMSRHPFIALLMNHTTS